MSVSSTLPLKVADTGPILVLTTAAKPLSPVFSSDSQPGIEALSTSGSLRAAQTFGLSAGKVTSPVIVIAIDVFFLRGLGSSGLQRCPRDTKTEPALLAAFRIGRKDQNVGVPSPDLRRSWTCSGLAGSRQWTMLVRSGTRVPAPDRRSGRRVAVGSHGG